MKITAYHGTDAVIAEKICKTNFQQKYNHEHWLGNGIYFYTDLSLALWWTTNPSVVFGSQVDVPAVIATTFDCPDSCVLDLRILSDYNNFTNIYIDDFLPMIYEGIFSCSYQDSKQLRCVFCDYLSEAYNVKCIIGNFDLPRQSYLPGNYQKISNKLKIRYIETQVCLFDTQCITSKEIIPL